MSVKAYLIKKLNIKEENNEITIEKTLEKKPTFNLSNERKILKLFQDAHGDNTNEDLTGELIMDKYSWNNIITKLKKNEYCENELKIIKKISDDLKDNEIIYFDCF